MKTVLFLLALAVAAFASEFSDGWCAGYQAGYCFGQQFCIKPICPIAPIPDIGEDSWQDGYNRGFLQGLAAKN